MVLRLGVFSVLAVLVIAASAVKIPPELKLKRCSYTDPEIDACLRVAIEDAIPKLKDGAPELGIPVLDPVEITEISLETDKNAPINLSMKLKNLKIHRSSDMTLKKFHWDNKNMVIAITAHNDKIIVEGDYESTGRLLAIPITGKGPITIELTDVYTDLSFTFKEVERKGNKYWDVEKMVYDVFKVGNMKMKLEGLIKGNKPLNDNLNQVINENWQELDQQMRPVFGKALKMYFLGITQRFFKRVPPSDIFDGFVPRS